MKKTNKTKFFIVLSYIIVLIAINLICVSCKANTNKTETETFYVKEAMMIPKENGTIQYFLISQDFKAYRVSQEDYKKFYQSKGTEVVATKKRKTAIWSISVKTNKTTKASVILCVLSA